MSDSDKQSGSTSESDSEALLAHAAVTIAARKQRERDIKQQAQATVKTKMEKKKQKKKGRKDDDTDDDNDEEHADTPVSVPAVAVSPNAGSYEQWKARQAQKQQQKQQQQQQQKGGGRKKGQVSAAPYEEKADEDGDGEMSDSSSTAPSSRSRQPSKPSRTRVPVSVERARATRQADIDSGVAGALRNIANKKAAKKAEKKRAKKLAAAAAMQDEDEEEEDAEGEKQVPEDEGSEGEQDEEGDDASDTNESIPQHPPSAGTAAADDATAVDDDLDEYASFEESLQAYREIHDIKLHSLDESEISSASLEQKEEFYPVTTFHDLAAEFSLDARLLNASIQPSFNHPTPIQAQCWPLLLAGMDVIGVAQTGSGKTLAFLLPAFFYIMQVRERDASKGIPSTSSTSPSQPLAPCVLILAPTRELAIQIANVTSDIASKLSAAISSSSSSSPDSSSSASASTAALASPIRSFVVFGGTSLEMQQNALRSLPSLDILLATPGRLLQHLALTSSSGDDGESKQHQHQPSSASLPTTQPESATPPVLTLSRVGFAVLDEADRMLDLGFADALRTLAASLPTNRQTCLFSATWEGGAQEHAARFLARGAIKTVKVVIGSEGLHAARTVTQVVEVIDRRAGRREKRLLELLEDIQPSASKRLLIFVLYKRESQQLADYLQRKGWRCVSISGDKSQSQRASALQSFRSGEVPILVATDVAARGIDVQHVTHVINFSLGLSVEQYIHRIGRCGRAGQSGHAHTFVVDFDAPHTPELVKLLRESGQAVSAELEEMAQRAERQAEKQLAAQGSTLKGDAYYAALRSGLYSKHVNVAKQLAKEREEEEIERRIFGEESDDASTPAVVQRGRKQKMAHMKKGAPGRKGGKGRR